MKVIYGIGRLKLKKNSCVTVGVFDGLHLGHQFIIRKLVSLAKRNGTLSVVLTFYPHPDSIIKPKIKPPLLVSLKHRLNLINSFGVDICVVVNFNSGFSQIKARDFIIDILIRKFRMKDMIVDRNFIFGKDRKGNVQLLSKLAKEFNFRVHSQEVLKFKGKTISSTLIRSLITRGDLKAASKLLGRNVEVIGTVVGGDSRGRKLGFPTANIDPHHEVIPPKGVYFIEAWLGEKKFLGLANIGHRPTFKNEKKEIIELHLLNFNRNIYGNDLKVMFLKKLRAERRFQDRSQLIAQIKKDIQKAQTFFSI